MNPTTLVLVAATAGALACGAPAAPVTPANTPDPAAPSGKHRLDCPTAAGLEALARTVFAAPTGAVDVTCTALYHGGPRWLLDGWHLPDDGDGVAMVSALIDAERQAPLWVDGAGQFDFPSGFHDKVTVDEKTAVDLDADGADELIAITGSASQGYEEQTLAVMVVTATGLTQAGAVPFALDDSGADLPAAEHKACATTWTLAAGPDGTKQLALTVTGHGRLEAGDCLAPGRHLLRWDGQALVEAP